MARRMDLFAAVLKALIVVLVAGVSTAVPPSAVAWGSGTTAAVWKYDERGDFATSTLHGGGWLTPSSKPGRACTGAREQRRRVLQQRLLLAIRGTPSASWGDYMAQTRPCRRSGLVLRADRLPPGPIVSIH